jgi:hypothetical protein
MKDFSKSAFKISATSREVRLAYTGFLAFAFIGYLTLALIGLLRVGPGYRDIVIHYRGSEAEEAFPRAFGQMLEETHFHAFIEGVTLLVLTHLFIGTAVRRSTKSAVILLAFGATLSDLASPWLIRYVAPGFALLQMASWAFIAGTALVLMGVPLYEMWWKGGR